MAVRGTWNFVRHPATLAQGRASEAQMNMDVHLHRLPHYIICTTKFLESLADEVSVSVAGGQPEVSGQSNRKDSMTTRKNV